MRKIFLALALVAVLSSAHATTTLNSFTGPPTAFVGEEIKAVFDYNFTELFPEGELLSFNAVGIVDFGNGEFADFFTDIPVGMDMWANMYSMAGHYNVSLTGMLDATFAIFDDPKMCPDSDSMYTIYDEPCEPKLCREPDSMYTMYDEPCEPQRPDIVNIRGTLGYDFEIWVMEVPEASTIAMFGLGLLGIGAAARRKRA